MKKAFASKHHMDTLIAILLFGVFAVCVLMVLFSGTGVYKRLNRQNRDNYYKRTCTQYLITRIHKSSELETMELSGNTALLIHEKIEGSDYVTYVYYYDGFIREYFAEYGNEPQPEFGEKIIEADGLALQLTDGLLKAEVTAVGQSPVNLLLDVRDKGVDKYEK